MHLYVTCRYKKCGSQIHIPTYGITRNRFVKETGSAFFEVTCHRCSTKGSYSVMDVMAEPGWEYGPAAGLITGGAIGILFGPFGVILGAVGGLCLGWIDLEKEKAEAAVFNETLVAGAIKKKKKMKKSLSHQKMRAVQPVDE